MDCFYQIKFHLSYIVCVRIAGRSYENPRKGSTDCATSLVQEAKVLKFYNPIFIIVEQLIKHTIDTKTLW